MLAVKRQAPIRGERLAEPSVWQHTSFALPHARCFPDRNLSFTQGGSFRMKRIYALAICSTFVFCSALSVSPIMGLAGEASLQTASIDETWAYGDFLRQRENEAEKQSSAIDGLLKTAQANNPNYFHCGDGVYCPKRDTAALMWRMATDIITVPTKIADASTSPCTAEMSEQTPHSWRCELCSSSSGQVPECKKTPRQPEPAGVMEVR